jgi:hypothetical protein
MKVTELCFFAKKHIGSKSPFRQVYKSPRRHLQGALITTPRIPPLGKPNPQWSEAEPGVN